METACISQRHKSTILKNWLSNNMTKRKAGPPANYVVTRELVKMSSTAIASELGMTKNQVERILRVAKEKLHARMRDLRMAKEDLLND